MGNQKQTKYNQKTVRRHIGRKKQTSKPANNAPQAKRNITMPLIVVIGKNNH